MRSYEYVVPRTAVVVSLLFRFRPPHRRLLLRAWAASSTALLASALLQRADAGRSTPRFRARAEVLIKRRSLLHCRSLTRSLGRVRRGRIVLRSRGDGVAARRRATTAFHQGGAHALAFVRRHRGERPTGALLPPRSHAVRAARRVVARCCGERAQRALWRATAPIDARVGCTWVRRRRDVHRDGRPWWRQRRRRVEHRPLGTARAPQQRRRRHSRRWRAAFHLPCSCSSSMRVRPDASCAAKEVRRT